MKLSAWAAPALSAALLAGLGAGPSPAAAATAPKTRAPSAQALGIPAPGSSPASSSSVAGRAMRAALLRQRQAALQARRPGTVTGLVRSFTGQPVAGACVTAFGASGDATTRASSRGRFSVSGLRAGSYTLKFSGCAQPGQFLPQWSGGAQVQAMARPVQISAGRVTAAGTVTLRPAGQSALARQSAASVHARAAGLPAAASLKLGGISGRVTDRAGRAITNTCAEVHFKFGYLGMPVTKTGHWSTGKGLPPGRYKVEFANYDCNNNPGNWAPQWYRNQTRASAATRVRVVAGKITPHVDARLRHGGIISGTVTGQAGKRLDGACAALFTPGGTFLALRSTSRGRYEFRGLAAGRYRMEFQANCSGRSTPYLWQWWRGTRSFARAHDIRVRLGHHTRGISARLVIGGKIGGTVRFRTAAGRPVSGICVDLSTGSPLTGTDYAAATGKNGTYLAEGLPPGRYTVQFFPGCNNNGNYLGASYPRRVTVALGQLVRNVSVVLQPGGIISGTVTDSRGKPLQRILVFAGDPQGDGNDACTSATGAYSMNQLPPGSYTVEFASTCGASGNYAPQYYPGQPSASTAHTIRIWPGRKVTGINAAMQPGATITGMLTSRAGEPASKVCVSAQSVSQSSFDASFGDGFAGYQATTASNGSYRIRDLAGGRYAVQFIDCGAPRYASRWFGGRPGAAIGDTVTVPAGATVGGIGAVLAPGGAISGTVRTSTGKPLADACEIVTSLRTGLELASDIGFSSQYRISGLAPGRYSVEFYDCTGTNYAIQWYSKRPGPGSATPVRVTAGRTTGSVDAALPRGGRITGRLTAAATGRPVRGFCVAASTASGSYFGSGYTGKNGGYVISGLNTGSYRLSVSNCADNAGIIAAGGPARTVRVVRPHTVAGINLARPPGGSVSGRVLGGSPAVAQGQVCVDARPVTSGGTEGFGVTGSDGRYQVRNLPAGQYQVFFDTTDGCDDSLDGLVPQWYDGAGSRAAARVITVSAGLDTTGIDATLRADGGISGTVTARQGGAALTGVCVRVVPRAAGRAAGFTATSGGSYRITGLAPGQYTVRLGPGCGASGYATQWWKGASSAAAATVLRVRAGVVTSGIDAALAK